MEIIVNIQSLGSLAIGNIRPPQQTHVSKAAEEQTESAAERLQEQVTGEDGGVASTGMLGRHVNTKV